MRKLISKKGSLLLAVLSLVLLQFSGSKVSAIACIEKEREALLQFKKSFDDPSHRLASWKGTDCCNWNGVGCNEATGHVIKIDLRKNQVTPYALLRSNSIDSSLLEFKYLEYLDLSFNNFYLSQIPNFLGSMLELRYLNLSHASFYGKVPPHLGNLTKLVVLDLSTNEYSNMIWESLYGDVEWTTHLSSLQILDLSGMKFVESSNLMQVLTSLPLLSSLKLSSCSLQNIHLSLGSLNSSFLSRIQLLDLSSNYFNGPIPEAFQNMSSLRFLYLSKNEFTTIEGGLSSFIGNHCGLKEFDLSFNHDLRGRVFGISYENESMGCKRYDLQVLHLINTSVKDKIPDWLGKLKNLWSLSLLYSGIYGPIPASLGNLSSLEYLYLSNNPLTGAIPTSLGRLLNLRELHLGSTKLEELGVECFSQLRNLEVLDISNTSLKGVISEAHFAKLSQLHVLAIGYSDFLSLDMKSNWIPPFQLTFLYAASCKCFGSKFPQWLQTQKELKVLQLFNMSISSALPTWLGGQSLVHLDLSHNLIVGPIPTSIGDQMPNLRVLFLNDNQINNSLPLSVCQLKFLGTLDFSNNRLSGMVHGCLLTPNLVLLDLSSNKFSGAFPYSPGNLSNIQQLFLGNNNFEGPMPIVLKNSIYLSFLDLEGNQFSGNIPTWVGDNLEYLQVLNLRGNYFNSSIPSNLCYLTHLQILDLSNNKLVGNIPPNLSNFSVMTGKIRGSSLRICILSYGMTCKTIERYRRQHFKSSNQNFTVSQVGLLVNIDLSNNSLVGFIPREITMLKQLLGLNLSHNNLVGTIPSEMGRIVALESLDLSFNQLSGPISRSLSELDALGVLELSHNNLSGEIPREGHFSTFNEASNFEGNPYLCGDPLPKKCMIENPFEPSFIIENDLDQEKNNWEKWMLYIMIMLGYVNGFWMVVGVLILKASWRHAYFRFVDETEYKVHVAMWRSIERLKEICNHE